MGIPLIQFAWRGARIHGIRPSFVIDARPEPDNDDGWRYRDFAAMLESHFPGPWPGVIVMDPDVAADPDDLAAMLVAAAELPGDVHTATIKNWPASTGRGEWMWSRRPGTLGNPVATQDECAPVAYFATDFTYLPARLLQLAVPVMPSWKWREGDVQLSELALANGIPAHAVAGCRPKHLHF